MSARAAATEADIRRAIKAALSAGLKPGQFEVRADREGVSVMTYAEARAAPEQEEPNAWDEVHFNEWDRHLAAAPKLIGSPPVPAAPALQKRIAKHLTPEKVRKAYVGHPSLGEKELLRLLRVDNREFAALIISGLIAPRGTRGPVRYTQEAVLQLVAGDPA